MSISMTTVEHQRWLVGSLNDEQLAEVAELHLAAFGANGRTVDSYVEQRLRKLWQRGQGTKEERQTAVIHVIIGDGRLVAKAITFGRTIATRLGPRNVMGLSGVAAHPDAQGGGWGKKIVQQAFARIDDGEFTTCLFQTGRARNFYERIGCRVVDNEFVNSKSDNPTISPWSDDFVMIYPGSSDWPTGKIDLLGPGY